MAPEKVVWLLGSGFSKPLGGPLLRDLFRQQDEEDILPYFPDQDYPDLARALPWVQKCFHLGKHQGNDGAKGLWADAEEFLAYVDHAFSSSSPTPARKVLGTLIDKAGREFDPSKWFPKDPSRHFQHSNFNSRMPGSFDREVKRALAAECHRFLMHNGDESKSERWLPYRKWLASLRPDLDTVITFNYDLVMEAAASAIELPNRLRIVTPHDQDFPPGKVTVLKLHGSVDWRKSGGQVEVEDVLKSKDVDIAIAAPGGSKEELAGGDFKPLWERAEKALTEADRLIIVGYSFPASDPAAQYRLLNAFSAGNTLPQGRSVHIVLGPDAPSTTTRRMLSLVRSTAPANRLVFIGEWMVSTGGVQLYIVEHPLGAQDFIGRHAEFTTPRGEWRG